MTIEAMKWAMKDAPVESPAEAMVLLCLADHANQDGTCAWPSHETIAKVARMTDRNVRYILQRLEARGIIRRGDQARAGYIQARYRPVVWDLNMDAQAAPEAAPAFTDSRAEIHDSRAEIHDSRAEIHDAEGGNPRQSGRKPTSDEPSTKPTTEPTTEPARESGRRPASEPPRARPAPARPNVSRTAEVMTARDEAIRAAAEPLIDDVIAANPTAHPERMHMLVYLQAREQVTIPPEDQAVIDEYNARNDRLTRFPADPIDVRRWDDEHRGWRTRNRLAMDEWRDRIALRTIEARSAVTA